MINIVVPMAGRGSRFAGTNEWPKPLIEVIEGKRMIEFVIDYLTLAEPHRFFFVCLAEHERAFGISQMLRQKVPTSKVILTETVTRGPAASAHLASPFIDIGEELLVAYCDSFLTIDMAHYLNHARSMRADGMVGIYPSRNPMESYAEVDSCGSVLKTAEKSVISPNATAGLYYFRRGQDFVSAAERTMAREVDSGTELFVCPLYNELIAERKSVTSYPMRRSQSVEMGTPEDLSRSRLFLRGIRAQDFALPQLSDHRR
jgi:NDP-sugar pyrophosphorylase family protein